MKYIFIDKEINYTGKELAPHWIYKNFEIQGDAIVSFIGECRVNLSEMVDIKDVLSNSPIYSGKMLNFIVEHFNLPLTEMVLRQRMLVVIAKEVIEEELGYKILLKRSGDDLFFKDEKLSVSIATKSLTSSLIHFGINIDATNAPVKACGLSNTFHLENSKQIALKIMERYQKEMDSVWLATCKVRGV